MNNRWDIGIQEDLDNMTTELGRNCRIYLKSFVLDAAEQEAEPSNRDNFIEEIVMLQELKLENKLIISGAMEVGTVKFTFLANTKIKTEAVVSPDEGITKYKVIKLDIIRNQSNNTILEVKGYGKRISHR